MDKRFSALQKSPLSDFSVLNYKTWPPKNNAEEFMNYGKVEVEWLIDHFAPVLSAEEVANAPRAWLAFKLHIDRLRTSCQKQVFKNLLLCPPDNLKSILPIIEIMMCISMSTAVVERGFSHMNNVKGPERTRMGRDTLNDLMEIQINGPSQVVNFCGDRALLHWLDNTKGQGTRHINGHSSPTC